MPVMLLFALSMISVPGVTGRSGAHLFNTCSQEWRSRSLAASFTLPGRIPSTLYVMNKIAEHTRQESHEQINSEFECITPEVSSCLDTEHFDASAIPAVCHTRHRAANRDSLFNRIMDGVDVHGGSRHGAVLRTILQWHLSL